MKLRTTTVAILITLGVVAFPLASMAQVSCSSASTLQFVPSWGQFDIGSSSSGTRYIYQYMSWNSGSRLAWFWNNADSTFEPDAFFYNYNDSSGYGPAYGDRPGGYWGSNLPIAYVDTQDGDPPGEKAVTIGSLYARNLVATNLYYTYAEMVPGSGSRSLVKLSVQRGRKNPDSCLVAWCSWYCYGTNNVHVIPFSWHMWAPGSAAYTYQ